MSSIIKVNTVQDQDGNNIINENANTITIGKSGDTVQVASGASLVGAGIEWQSTIVTAATHTASAGQGLWLDTSSNAITLTLPSSPSVGDQVIFTDYARNWETNAVTLNLNSEKFQGNTTPVPVYDTNGESVNIVYSGSTKGWIPNTDGAVALETPQTYSLEMLVIAGGGGGGGHYYGGGGGAGGYRTSTQTISPGVALTVTVGDGGAIGTPSAKGSNGGNTSISGSGLTTITSAGGGGGGSDGGGQKEGANGGSGGGGSGYTTVSGDRGIGDTPSTSPSQGFDGGYNTQGTDYGGGGGGGAGAVGGISSNDNGGAGGAGTASSITGSSVTRAGGGGGAGGENSGTAGAGGAGGGGLGGRQSPATAGAAGTVNTGGGGGASADPSALGGAGGKGVLILSMPDASYSGTTTGSPTVATGVSGKTVLTFTGSGSYTA